MRKCEDKTKCTEIKENGRENYKDLRGNLKRKKSGKKTYIYMEGRRNKGGGKKSKWTAIGGGSAGGGRGGGKSHRKKEREESKGKGGKVHEERELICVGGVVGVCFSLTMMDGSPEKLHPSCKYSKSPLHPQMRVRRGGGVKTAVSRLR